eukprot:XP_011671992.1 PREDICTED: leukocyte receptor cluster member 8 homolog [Strongylocentrotus purpuratus]
MESQQYGAASVPSAANPSWEIARKALEKLGDSSGEAGSSGEGSGKESKGSPEKKAVDVENRSGKQLDSKPQEGPDFMSQHQMNMYGNYYGPPYGGRGGGGGMYPYSGYGQGYGMPPPHMRGGPYQGMHGYHPPPGSMYPPYGPRPTFGEHRGPGFPPQRPRGPMSQGPAPPPPPPPNPPHSLLGKPDPSPPPPLPSPSSKTSSSTNPSHQSKSQVSGESDAGGGGGAGRGGEKRGFPETMKFRQEAQQLHTGSRWNKNLNQPSDTQGIRFNLPSKRSGMHPSPMGDTPGNRGQGQQNNQFNNNKKKGGKQDNTGGQQTKKPGAAKLLDLDVSLDSDDIRDRFSAWIVQNSRIDVEQAWNHLFLYEGHQDSNLLRGIREIPEDVADPSSSVNHLLTVVSLEDCVANLRDCETSFEVISNHLQKAILLLGRWLLLVQTVWMPLSYREADTRDFFTWVERSFGITGEVAQQVMQCCMLNAAMDREQIRRGEEPAEEIEERGVNKAEREDNIRRADELSVVDIDDSGIHDESGTKADEIIYISTDYSSSGEEYESTEKIGEKQNIERESMLEIQSADKRESAGEDYSKHAAPVGPRFESSHHEDLMKFVTKIKLPLQSLAQQQEFYDSTKHNLHQDVASCSSTGISSDLGIQEQTLPASRSTLVGNFGIPSQHVAKHNMRDVVELSQRRNKTCDDSSNEEQDKKRKSRYSRFTSEKEQTSQDGLVQDGHAIDTEPSQTEQQFGQPLNTSTCCVPKMVSHINLPTEVGIIYRRKSGVIKLGPHKVHQDDETVMEGKSCNAEASHEQNKNTTVDHQNKEKENDLRQFLTPRNSDGRSEAFKRLPLNLKSRLGPNPNLSLEKAPAFYEDRFTVAPNFQDQQMGHLSTQNLDSFETRRRSGHGGKRQQIHPVGGQSGPLKGRMAQQCGSKIKNKGILGRCRRRGGRGRKKRRSNFVGANRCPVDATKDEDGREIFHHVVEIINDRSLVSPADWPPSLKDYVQRAFNSCQNESEKDKVESHLKKILTEAHSQGTVMTKDWSLEPLPLSPHPSPTPKSPNDHPEAPWSASRNQENSPRYGSSNYADMSQQGLGRGRGRGRGQWNKNQENQQSRYPARVASPAKGRHGRKIFGFSREYSSDSDSSFSRSRNVGNVNYADDRERTMRMQKRAARFQDMLGEDDSPASGKKQRTQKLSLQINEDLTGEGDDVEWSMEPIVGTSQEEWKQYLRLTTAPDPSQVRPISVLRKSLVKVKDRWKEKQDYPFVCEQLKSIRQDLTIQCIRNEFSVEVYETHGRIALEKGDVSEFNQCQTQLKALYSEGIPGNIHEFQAYRILYYISMENTMEMNTALATLKPESRQDPLVKHALELRSAWAMSDYHKFFKLYRTAPRMGSYVIDMFIARERKAAIKTIVKSFRPMVSVEYVANSLAFDSNEECIEFLTELGTIVLNADRTKVDCKQSTTAMTAAAAS